MRQDDKKYERIKGEYQKRRKKDWGEKVSEVCNSFARARKSPRFIDQFYTNLFFLKPGLEKYFVHTKWSHQKIALDKGMEHLLGFLNNDPGSIDHKNIVRLSVTHSAKNLGIHPHDYYYWIDAMIMTLKELDDQWYTDLQYYTRECLFFPISFMISMYHKT